VFAAREATLRQHGLVHAAVRVWVAPTLLDLAFQVIATTDRGVAICLCSVVEAKRCASAFGCWTVIESLCTFRLGALLVGGTDCALDDFLQEAADFAGDHLLHRLQLALGGCANHLLQDRLGTTELHAFDVGSGGVEAMGLAVPWNGWAFLAHTIGEFACSRFAGTFKCSWLPLVWCIWHGIFTSQSAIVRIRLGDAHLRLAFATAIRSPPVLACEVVLSNVNTPVARSEPELTHILVRRAATEAIRMLHRAIRLGIVQVAANLVVTIWLQALIFATLALPIGALLVRCTCSGRGGIGDRKAKKVASPNQPLHLARIGTTLLALDSRRVFDVWLPNALEFAEFICTPRDCDNRLGGQNLACRRLGHDSL